MYTNPRYSLRDMLLWTRMEVCYFVVFAMAIAVLYEAVGLQWLRLPWTPIALVGTAVAFLIGFQNNAAYGRAWEARKVWGGIVNESRTWAIMVRDMVTNDHAVDPASAEDLEQNVRTLVDRHIAWLTALRFAMRSRRPWEVFTKHRTNREWHDKVCIPERDGTLEADLAPLLTEDEHNCVMQKTNKPAAILGLQSVHLRTLKQRGLVWEFSFLELEGMLRELFALQGKSERIKNFPYPRQYASLSYIVVHLFILLLPFGVIPEFSEIGGDLQSDFPQVSRWFVWLGVPFTALISWVFHSMQRIGIVGENPFEGSANDVPISTMARAIEIDLRELLDEPAGQIPKPIPAVHGVQM